MTWFVKKIKKIFYFIQLFDFVWSVPLAMSAFIGFGVLLQIVFTNPADPQGAPGFYDPSFLQAAFYASCMQVFINGCVWGGIYFNFRGLWRYYSGIKQDDGKILNRSKDDFLNLLPWQRIKLLVFLYCFLSLEWAFLFSLLQ